MCMCVQVCARGAKLIKQRMDWCQITYTIYFPHMFYKHLALISALAKFGLVHHRYVRRLTSYDWNYKRHLKVNPSSTLEPRCSYLDPEIHYFLPSTHTSEICGLINRHTH